MVECRHCKGLASYNASMLKNILDKRSAAAFLRNYWQKRPFKHVLQDFAEVITVRQLFELACAAEVESRLVIRSGRNWSLQRGPFRSRDFRKLPKAGWTLLVQGVNLYHRDADALLRRFSFIPYARLDDLMISYAVPGGGVGPHFDSYDVFLLQARGRRRWQISAQSDLALRPDLPLKILRRFKPEQQWILSPSNMLYLPPSYAHHGTALDECMTYSIGFRAPSAQEAGQAFLDYLHDQLSWNGAYHDADLKTQDEPALISNTMVAQVAKLLSEIHWRRSDVAHFLGCYLTEPKNNVFFTRPQPPLSQRQFALRCQKHGVELNLKTQLLFQGEHYFLNGQAYPLQTSIRKTIKQLANQRKLSARELTATALLRLLYGWYKLGYLYL